MVDSAISAYVVHTSDELRAFPEKWGIRSEKVHWAPYYHYVTSDILEQDVQEKGFVFSGGNSKRDYHPLIEAARMLPDIEFVIATNRLEKRTDIPANVTFGPMSHVDYYLSMKSAAAVVTPIRTNLVRAAGQQTYLNAMRLGRPVIVNDTYGVRDHIRDNVDGIIVDGSPQSYRDAICHVLDPANEKHVRSMVESALQRVEAEFTRSRYLERLYDVARTVSSGS
ncbi:glycosyltransferase [Tropicimonas marinistellae]|uniref:glycosyltransferase n=1 Tax=Tropicimonas marinistellae TaxID=1739787 RepID=UPI001F2B97F8|nr:glycosyltransferase [Tropicimonas marinistellae]